MISIGLTYYNQPEMLRRQISTLNSWLPKLRQATRIVIVDDGSRQFPADKVLAGQLASDFLSVDLFWITQDKPWNQDGARNLVMSRVESDWTLITDLDHLIEPDQAMILHDLCPKRGVFYVPARRKVDGSYKKPHPNSYFIHPKDYWMVGGYDEDFCGWYGSDSLFRRQLNARLAEKRLDCFSLTLVEENEIPDAKSSGYGRKGSDLCIKKHPLLKEKQAQIPYRPSAPCRFLWEHQNG